MEERRMAATKQMLTLMEQIFERKFKKDVKPETAKITIA